MIFPRVSEQNLAEWLRWLGGFKWVRGLLIPRNEFRRHASWYLGEDINRSCKNRCLPKRDVWSMYCAEAQRRATINGYTPLGTKKMEA